MLKRSPLRAYTTFPVNPETSQPTTGAPRGLVNKMATMGLPPWAAWTRNLDAHARYRLSGATKTSFLPKYRSQMEHIWLNESVRERVRSVKDKQYIRRELKYPYTLTGVWYSDALDHWVQVPHVQAAKFAIEKDGGIDNFVLKRTGNELHSSYGERLRRNVLVRQREIEKNFLLQKSAERLAEKIVNEAAAAGGGGGGGGGSNSEAGAEAVLQKYGLRREDVVNAAAQLKEQVDGGGQQQQA